MKFTILLTLLFAVNATANVYFRDPDLRGDTLVFTAEGDLWLTSASGGNARRLTTHPADETQARISADGSMVAFLAAYDDTAQVHVIPAAGGVARQLTFESGRVKVHGWTEDGKVIFSTNGRAGASFTYQLRTVDPRTLDSEPYPLSDVVEGTVAGDQLYFVQFGMQISGDNVRAYRGGAKGRLWRFTLGGDAEAEPLIVDHKGSIRRPMVDGDTLFFISDASGVENLWAMNIPGGEPAQVTNYRDWSIRGISVNDGRAVFQLGADLVRFDLDSRATTTLPVNLTSDFPALRERWLTKPMKFATSYHVNGDGERLAITARGRAILAGTDTRRLVEIALPEASRIRQATLGPDSKWVYGLNDSSGEVELWRFAADGSMKAEQLTEDGDNFRWNFSLSPDGRWVAHADNNGDIWLLDTRNRSNKRIVDYGAGLNEVRNLAWSPDSQLLAISYTPRDEARDRLMLYSIDRKEGQMLTSARWESFAPTFSRDGQWLYFLSEREFKPFPTSPWGDRNMGAAFDRRVGIFALALTEDAQFPFADTTELTPDQPEAPDDEDDTPAVKIDWDGIEQRLRQVPLPAGNYTRLAAGEERLYFLDLVRAPEAVPSLQSITFEPEPEAAVFAENVQEFSLSADGKKVFVRQKDDNNGKLYIVDVGEKFPEDPKGTQVQTKQWRLRINPQEEWRQMFHDAWLMHRDQFFDPDMRGLDWPAIESKYRPLLDRLADRRDLDDLLAQMMGELGALHSSVGRGDYRKDATAPKFASLGAEFSQGRNGVTLAHIFRHDPELPATASPLAQPGVDARQGDRIVAINGQPISHIGQIGPALWNQKGQQVLITLERGRQQHPVVVMPTDAAGERTLRFQDWSLSRADRVAAANPDIGYLRLRSMVGRDIGSFARDFYVNTRKPALIIDVRRNTGGNVDSLLIEKLMRRAWSFWNYRSGSLPQTNMQNALRGHLVVLADQYTYSDGETFTAGIQALELATVIGKQTAGAGVWLRGLNPLVDKGRARVSEFPVFALDGRWINEGTGVAPNIEVDNLPHATFKGEDAQLQAAIDYLERRMREAPVPPLKGGPFPPGTAPAHELKNR